MDFVTFYSFIIRDNNHKVCSLSSCSKQRTGGLFGNNMTQISSEPSSPTSAGVTNQRPLQFSESRPGDTESPPPSAFLPVTEFSATPTRSNTNNNAANFFGG